VRLLLMLLLSISRSRLF